ncbi:MAG: 2-succinyl-5-enolpyruvyl-6-hydroxy-3-cyclohexene-1-carboxylic-acid synthase [Gammaproteobacteria bacterium]|nr:2-succinyl-5-enolpyruvyl-6-hydroxy-3-cyclohexene-1-carboxylic-acid synthase [Gammaproteobacteria bacterium]
MKPAHSQTKNSTGAINYQWAFGLIHYFALQGVTQAVISPGSRSTPLALACERHPDITTWVQIDERSAGFFALGLAQQEQQPAILICTSGSAVANWFPAVVEASHSYTPLLLLSADRPAELQNCGANQTIDQNFLFGSHVRQFIALEHADETLLKSNYLKRITTQAYGKTLYRKPGPVHLNIPFREPLLPRRFTADELNHFINRLSQRSIESATPIIQSNISSSSISSSHLSKKSLDLLTQIVNSGNGLIICGRLTYQEKHGFEKILSKLAEKLNCPVLVDPLSTLRHSALPAAHFIYNYDHFLKQYRDNNKKFTPDWILRFGQFPVSKNLLNYLQQLDSHSILVSSYGDSLDPIHKANTLLHTSPDRLCQQLLKTSVKAGTKKWLHDWQKSEQRSEDIIHETLDKCTALFEGHVINTLLDIIPENSLLYSGNSMAIRDFDTFVTRAAAHGKKLSFHCNRGTSGIDGNLSTFFGLLGKQTQINKSYGVALLGDLSFYHDMNGLLIGKQLNELGYSAAIIVINNNGGGIFNYLPQNQLDDFDKLWKTETNLDFQHSAELYGLNYQRIENHQELETKLPAVISQSGIQIVEVIIEQQTSVKCHKKI